MNADNLVVAGLNHLLAPLSTREKAAVPASERESVLDELSAAGLRESVLLSTCSRIELVVAAEDPEAAEAWLAGWFARRAGDEAAASLRVRRGSEALRHVFRVAAGLDSWIVGESEILGQVKEAYRFSLEEGRTRRTLNRIFQRAIEAGKLVRSRTGLQGGVHSIGGAAALLARRVFGEKDGGQVVVFGAGQAAEDVARHLAAKAFGRLVVANRTLERARAVAEPLGARAASLDEGLALLGETEIAVFSLGGGRPLLDAAALKRRLAGRKRPLFLIDLGLPRNVEPACARLDGVYLYDLDDLRAVVRERSAQKAAEKERAEVLAALAAAECAVELEAGRPRPARGQPAAPSPLDGGDERRLTRPRRAGTLRERP